MSTAVIIVSYNTKSLLRDCLSSFIATQTGEYEIWVLDNSSSDGSAEMVASEFPQVHLIKSDENLGFGKGNNLIAQRTDTDYVLLINPDTTFNEDILGPMIDYFKRNLSVGVVGPRIIWPNGDLQLSCEKLPSLTYELAWQVHSTLLERLFNSDRVITSVRMEEYDHREPRAVEFLWATCWLVRREVVRELGLFDPAFRMYDEDLDFCARLAKSEWQAHYFPAVTMVHIGGMSSTPVGKQIMMRRGRRVFYRRHKGLLYAVAYRLSMNAMDAAKAVKHAVLAICSRKGNDHWQRAQAHARLARL